LVELVSATANFDTKAHAAYRAYYHERNEWFGRGVHRPTPLIAFGQEFIEDDAFLRTEFCTDWCMNVEILHLLAATFDIGEGVIGAIGIHRPRRQEAFGLEAKRKLVDLAHTCSARCSFVSASILQSATVTCRCNCSKTWPLASF
jgi:hypothetical protein